MTTEYYHYETLESLSYWSGRPTDDDADDFGTPGAHEIVSVALAAAVLADGLAIRDDLDRDLRPDGRSKAEAGGGGAHTYALLLAKKRKEARAWVEEAVESGALEQLSLQYGIPEEEMLEMAEYEAEVMAWEAVEAWAVGMEA